MNDCPTTGPVPAAVTFWGSAGAISGSLHLLEANSRRILLDCGRTPGSHDDDGRPVEFPFAPREIDAVIISHAHLDHCGHLPHLVRQGFHGPIYCTAATRDLVGVMLHDAARRDEEDARILRILHRADSAGPDTFLSHDDVVRALKQCVPVPYGEPREILPGVTLRLVAAGHLLGAAMAALHVVQDGRECRVTFTGDLGRRKLPLLRDPAPLPEADLVISECTYGGRVHEPLESVTARLAEVVERTVARAGRVLIPAFSLGRTQTIVACLHDARRRGQIPDVPIFIDSPLAVDIAEVYRRHPECLDAGTARRLEAGDDPLGGPGISYVRTIDESMALVAGREPCIVVASGAMCDAGRIVRHLRQHIDDPRSSIVLVSYQAPGSLGRRLLEPQPTVRFHGRVWNFWADVFDLNGFSAHADRDELLDFLGPVAARARHVRLVHGDPQQAKALAEALRGRGFADVGIPQPGETIALE
jgi:metallo-beta-lactamase family protein